MYEMFDHTADLGLRIQAADWKSLLVEAGHALFAAILENPASVRCTTAWTLRIDGDERDYLLYDWLRELLYRFDADHVVFGKFDVETDATGLRATIWGECLEPGRHELSHEVKAITYHALRVEETPTGWLAEVIVDI